MTSGSLEQRLGVLRRLYDLHDRMTVSRDLVCRRGCDRCCTANVTLTTLEALLIADGLGAAAAETLAPLAANPDPRRFRPRTGINTVAAMVLNGEDPPPEEADLRAGPCPLLRDRCCPIHALRPLACRCMVSTAPCDATGHATIEDSLLTVNTVFQQVVEDLDAAGATGNLSDLLPWAWRPDFKEACRRGIPDPAAFDLAPNRRLPALMIPPEHRARLAPVVRSLRACRGRL